MNGDDVEDGENRNAKRFASCLFLLYLITLSAQETVTRVDCVSLSLSLIVKSNYWMHVLRASKQRKDF